MPLPSSIVFSTRQPLHVDDRQRRAGFRRHVGARAVRQKRHRARPRSDLHRLDHLVRRRDRSTNTAPSSSDVTQTRPPDGSTETPSGSSPTLKLSTIWPLATSTTLDLRGVLVGRRTRCVPSRLTASCSGSVRSAATLSSFPCCRSTTPMPSALRSGGGSVFSSTPGPGVGRSAERDVQRAFRPGWRRCRAAACRAESSRPVASVAGVDDGEIA